MLQNTHESANLHIIPRKLMFLNLFTIVDGTVESFFKLKLNYGHNKQKLEVTLVPLFNTACPFINHL